jgi:enoyl-CoA hydratase/carnithine racemase
VFASPKAMERLATKEIRVPDSPILYEVNGAVGVITMNRPERANAQSASFLRDLHAAWMRASEDDDVRVIILRANGRHFSSGHDFKAMDELPKFIEGRGIRDMRRFEEEVFFGYCQIWRDIPKPSIAAVQGTAAAAGLMIAWPCDLIIAADDAKFGDPAIRLLSGAGVEYGAHTWELGPRKAKEMLFTGAFIDAQEAHRLGMVNRVVPRDELDEATMALASEIAEQDPFALRMAKRAVNVTQDIQGYHSSLQAVLDMHWVGHAHYFAVYGMPKNDSVTPERLPISLTNMSAANRNKIAEGSTAD